MKKLIDKYFEEMSQQEFESKFSELARTGAFSAVASNAFNPNDIAEVRGALMEAGISEDWLSNNLRILTVARKITSRILEKKTT